MIERRIRNSRKKQIPHPVQKTNGVRNDKFWSSLECGEADLRLLCRLGQSEFGGAVRAELVGVGDFALALRAGGMEIAFAVGAEIEPGIDAGGALRAGEGKRFSNKKIDDEANEEVAAGEQKNEQCPQAGIHATALGVAIDIAEREKQDGESDSAQGDDAAELKIGKLRVVTERFIAGEYGSVGLEAMMIDGEADDQGEEVEQEAQHDEPLGDDAELIAEAAVFALAAEADEAKAFCKCVGHVSILFCSSTQFVSH